MWKHRENQHTINHTNEIYDDMLLVRRSNKSEWVVAFKEPERLSNLSHVNTDTHAGCTFNHFTRPNRGWVDQDKNLCSSM